MSDTKKPEKGEFCADESADDIIDITDTHVGHVIRSGVDYFKLKKEWREWYPVKQDSPFADATIGKSIHGPVRYGCRRKDLPKTLNLTFLRVRVCNSVS